MRTLFSILFILWSVEVKYDEPVQLKAAFRPL